MNITITFLSFAHDAQVPKSSDISFFFYQVDSIVNQILLVLTNLSFFSTLNAYLLANGREVPGTVRAIDLCVQKVPL